MSRPATQEELNMAFRAIVELSNAQLDGPGLKYAEERTAAVAAGTFGENGVQAYREKQAVANAARKADAVPESFDAHAETRGQRAKFYDTLRRQGG